MENEKDITFLCRRLRELREKNSFTQEEMARKLNVSNKSTISRVEAGKTSYKTLVTFARDYCDAFGLSEAQTEQFLRGDKIAIPDTSALLKNTQLIEELCKEYSKVILPKVVIDELDYIKNHNSGTLGRKAWEIIRSIGNSERTLQMDYTGDDPQANNDSRIIAIARKAVATYGCKVDIITEDADFSAYLKGDEAVTAVHLREYMFTKQALVNMTSLTELRDYYSDDYSNTTPPSPEEVNAYDAEGFTLIISAVRNRKPPISQRKAKIAWLISHGADVDKRDCNRRYFPPLSHAIQVGDFEMFMFLLKDCQANPNVGSRNPHDAGKIRHKNEGNMPLMIAAWDNKINFVKALCEDERTSINQQDGNGFTALIKACYWGFGDCRDVLIAAGADTKIVDIDGKTYQNHWDDHFEMDRRKNPHKGSNKGRRHGDSKPRYPKGNR